MNREIKFRGLKVDGESWVESMTISKGTIKRKRDNVYFEIEEDKWIGVIPETVGQFTGAKDFHKNDIYEGDVLQNPKAEIGLVVWYQSGFHLECKRKNDSVFYIPLTDGFARNKKVIGNIHENPELLKGGNQ